MSTNDLVIERPQGLYCPQGDFYIDPWRAVPRAVITHAHSDHARAGHGLVLATAVSQGVLRARLGALHMHGLRYGEVVSVGDVRLSLHPAGHVLGSAQVRIEHRGRVWVVSGDYYLSAGDDHNPTCDAFEPMRCDVFVTESTFALPVYRWRPQREVLADIDAWWHRNAQAGRTSWLMAYSLGKAQRVLAGVDAGIGPIVVHASVAAINAAYVGAGVSLPPTQALDAVAEGGGIPPRALVIAPPTLRVGARKAAAPPSDDGCTGLGEVDAAFASGWMHLAGTRRRRGGGAGFALSDHADWPGLERAIRACGAGRVIVMHGYEDALVRWLREQGFDAGAFHTEFAADGEPA